MCQVSTKQAGLLLEYFGPSPTTMNLFKVPLGNVGKSLVAELSRLYNAFASGSALESIALMACYYASNPGSSVTPLQI